MKGSSSSEAPKPQTSPVSSAFLQNNQSESTAIGGEAGYGLNLLKP